MIPRRTSQLRVCAIFLVLVAMAMQLSACGPSARQQQLRLTLTGVSVASDAFVAFDQARQAQIVASASSVADGVAKLELYKTTVRNRVVDAFAAAFHALAAASILESAPKSLATALAATAEAMAAWEAFKRTGVTP